jgi:hypothetical protein
VPVATWRRPVLAPVYALVTAFLVVVGIGVATGAPAGATLRIATDPGVDTAELTGATVEVRDQAGARTAVGALSAQASYDLPEPADGRRLCLWLPAQWRITDPPVTGQCTDLPAGQAAKEFRVTVTRDAWVVVSVEKSEHDQAPALTDVTVSLRSQPRQPAVESGPPDAAGIYRPHSALGGRTVCVTPPRGWTVTGSSTSDGDRTRCATQAADQHKNFDLTLVKSDEGGGG